MFDVKGYLACLSTNALREISGRRNVRTQGMKRFDQIALLAPRLLERYWLEILLGRIAADARTALDIVRRRGGQMSGLALEDRLAEAGVAHPARAIWDAMASGLLLYSEREATGAAGELSLWDRGGFEETDHQLWLPPEVAALMGPPPPPEEQPDEPPALLEEYAGSTTPSRTPFASVIRDLYSIVQAVRAKPLGLTLAGYIRKPDLNRLNKALAPSEPIADTDDLRTLGRSDFIYHLCGRLGFLVTTKEPAAIQAGDEGLGFFRRPPAEQARLLLEAWATRSGWSELIRVPSLQVLHGYGTDLPTGERLTSARQTILDVLRRSEPGKWTSITSLWQVLQKGHVDFLYPRRRSRHFSLYQRPDDDCIPYEGLYRRGAPLTPENRLDKRRHWGLVEGAYIVSVLTEPLQWLGLVEIGLGSNGQPVAFRLTPEGAAALGLADGAALEPEDAPKALVVQPNLEMVLLPEVSGFGVAIELDRFADRVSTDRAIVYRLSRESIYRGLRDGLRFEELIATLDRLSKTDIPQNVRHSLMEWGGRFGAIRLFRQVIVATAPDAVALGNALRTAGIDEARRLAPTAAVLPRRPHPLRELRDRTSTRWCDYDAASKGVLHAGEDGRLVVPAKYRTPYLRYRLSAIGCEVEPGVFALDAARVRTALRGGLRAPEIEQFLSEAATGPLPPRIRLALRGWGGACRDVGLAPVTALRTDPEVLDLLLALPELSAGVVARPSPALALLDAEHAGAARALLDEFGLFVRDAIDGERPVAEGPLARAEPLYALAPKDLRAVLQRAVDEQREVVLLVTVWSKVVTERVVPLRLERNGSRYTLSARDAAGRERTFIVAEIHAIRLSDPAGRAETGG